MYTFKSRVRYSELDHSRGALSLTSIINYFQDCSTFQSEDLNIGISYLHSRNKIWLLNSWQLNILRPVTLGEEITLGTWASGFEGFYGYRNFIMEDKNHEIVAVANSIWIYLDATTQMPCKIPEDHCGYQLEPPYPMEKAARKIPYPKDLESRSPFHVMSSNIDSYHHVNNGQYVKMAEEYIPHNFYVTNMRVEYRKQAVLGDTIYPFVHYEKDIIYVILSNPDEKPYAILEFKGYYNI